LGNDGRVSILGLFNELFDEAPSFSVIIIVNDRHENMKQHSGIEAQIPAIADGMLKFC
jgi:hypothetical protein